MKGWAGGFWQLEEAAPGVDNETKDPGLCISLWGSPGELTTNWSLDTSIYVRGEPAASGWWRPGGCQGGPRLGKLKFVARSRDQSISRIMCSQRDAQHPPGHAQVQQVLFNERTCRNWALHILGRLGTLAALW